MNSAILRILLMPLGFFMKVVLISSNGSRDILNKFRFRGAIIDSNCCFNNRTKIAKHVHILDNCVINNSNIGAYSYFGKKCIIQNATIGSFCSIANDVYIGLGSHPIGYFSTSPLFYRKKNTFKIDLIEKDYEFEEYQQIEIGCDVWIGARATILDGVKIGDGAIVAAHSVVTKDIPPYAIVGGIPAKIIRYRFDSDKIERLLKTQWWNAPIKEIKEKITELNRLVNE